MILAYAEAYAREALGRDADLSGDTEPSEIINVLFESRAEAENTFQVGRLTHRGTKGDTLHLNFDLTAKKWSYDNSKHTGISLLSLGILLENWDWVNRFNPYERKSS